MPITPGNGLPTLENVLAADFALNSTTTFFDIVSVNLTPGTWQLIGKVLVTDTAAATYIAKLWDGTTVEDSSEITVRTANDTWPIPLAGYVTVTTTTTWKISVKDRTTVNGLAKAATVFDGSGNNATYIKALRIA